MTRITSETSSFLLPIQSATPFDESLSIIAVAVIAGAAIWHLGERVKARFRTENAEVMRAGLLLVLVSVVAIVSLRRWNATGDLLSVVGALRFSVNAGIRVLVTIVLFAAAHTATRIVKRLLLGGSHSNRRATSEHQRRVIFYVSQVVTYLVAVLGTFSLWGIQLSDLLLGAGVLGVILGLAFQNTLGSILAGFVLMVSRPFDVGHWVRIGDHEGFITEITINHVRLRNLDGEHVVLPNEAVNNRTIINRSLEGKLRHCVEVGVDYGVDPAHAESVAREAIADLDEIMTQPAPQVLPVRFDDSTVVLELRFWIDNPTPQRKWQAAQAVIYGVKTAFKREGIKIPFPQRELTERKDDDGVRSVSGRSRDAIDTDRSKTPTQSPK